MLANLLIALGGNDDYVGVAGAHFLDVADDFFVDVGGGGDSDEWGVGVEEGDGSVFEFASWEAFGVDVGLWGSRLHVR